jgi:riboflavin biosynthesis pyrimidine reductase
VFVEGGGVTVSMFLEAKLLDRLHMAIAPLFIGDGRPAIRMSPRAALGDCPRPRYRVFRMGGDVLFDCDFSSPANGVSDQSEGDDAQSRSQSSVTRVI